MSEPTAPRGGDGRHAHSTIWFWCWTLGVLALVLVPTFLFLRRACQIIAMAYELGRIYGKTRPLGPAPTIVRLLWLDAKLLPGAILWHGFAGLVLGSIVGLLQAAGVRRRARLRSWIGQAALAWVTGLVVGLLAARSYVIAVHPEVLLDVEGVEFFERMFAPYHWGVGAGVLAATIIQLRRLTVRPVRMPGLLVWPVAVVLFLHLGVAAAVVGVRSAELAETWRQQSVDALIDRWGWQTDWWPTAHRYDDACGHGMPAACAACAGMDDCVGIGVTVSDDGERERVQRIMHLDLLACAGGSGAGCAALANLYRSGRVIGGSEIWADMFDQHACLLGARDSCDRAPHSQGRPSP